MTFEDVIKHLSNILDTEGIRPLGKQQNHILISCPLAAWTHKGGQDRHPSFMVWFSEDKQTYYKCYSCGESGNFWRLFHEYGQKAGNQDVQALALQVLKLDTPTLASRFVRIGNKLAAKYQQEENDVQDAIKIIPDRVVERFELAVLNPMAHTYLQSRNVEDITALRFNLRFDARDYRICFPVYDEHNTCVAMVGRTIPPGDVEKRRYWNYFNFAAAESLGGYNFIKDYPYNKVLIVEGFFDVLNCWQWCLELEILPLCTWKAKVSKQQLKMLQGLDTIIISGYDPDAAGESGSDKLIKEGGLTGLTVKALKMPIGKDVGELTKEEFLIALENTKTRISQRFK